VKDLTMTRARTTKSTIRARMAKTGERYTTARRHVLSTAAAAPERVARPSTPTSPAAPAAQGDARGIVSEPKVIERTGHELVYWFQVLDRFGGVEKGHTASARHLRVDHGVDGWYSQGITVAYERARGLRTVNQRVGGTYEVSVTKMVDLDVAATRDAVAATRATTGWARSVDKGLVSALVSGLRGPTARGFVPASKASYRCRFRWNSAAVEMLLSPRPSNRTQVVVVCTKVPSADDVEACRSTWRTALAALQTSLNARDGASPRTSRATRRPTRRTTRA
jgi:hypothetical protein